MIPHSLVDLHMHSTASDGRLAPAELVAHVAAQGVKLMALTDHDTVDGIDAAEAAARKIGMHFVAGVELSGDWQGRTIHVLGLAIDPSASLLREGLRQQQDLRRARAERIAERLDAAGLPGAKILASIEQESTLPTRTHFARALVEHGAAPDIQGAFKRWLGRGCPAAVPSQWPTLEQVTGWVVAAGGAASIAHPLRYKFSPGMLRTMCSEFRQQGGKAVEVITGGQGPGDRERSISLAVRSGLAGSVGSDFHDPAVPWNRPGRLAKLPGSIRPVWTDPPFPPPSPDIEAA